MCASAIFIVVVELDVWWLFIRCLHIIADRASLAGKSNFLVGMRKLEGFCKLGEVLCSLNREATE